MHVDFDAAIDLLKDGKWHTIKEISQKCGLIESKTEIFANFLEKYAFLSFDKNEKKAKSSKAFSEFAVQAKSSKATSC